MKKNYTLILALLFSFVISAQGFEKIKGNRILEVQSTEISPYRILEIGENFEVVLVQQDSPKVRIETDSNLHEYIKIDVSAEKLSILTSETVSKFKKLYVEIGYNQNLSQIIAKGKVSIRGNTALQTERTELIASESANINLNFQSSRVEIKASDKAKITTNIKSESTAINAINNATIHCETNTESLNINLSEGSDLHINGTSSKVNFFLQDNSYLSAAELTSGIAMVTIKGTSEAYIKATDKLSLNASENSETYVLSNPLIEIIAFNDLAKLQKIKKAPGNGFSKLLR